MPTIYTHLPIANRTLVYAKERLGEIRQAIQELEHERVLWEHIMSQQNICPQCEGAGRVEAWSAGMVGTKYDTCPTCGGNGVKKRGQCEMEK